MLSSLFISNLALIKNCEINFKKGFNVILGQSGAGKSILIDALSFVLGAKADKTLIRSKENLMRVEAVFDNLTDKIKDTLTSNEIEFDDELILSRTLNIDGKSTIRVNGVPVVLKTLKEITLNLIDFCGQHDNVGLINENNHLSLLDNFIGNEANILLDKISAECDNLSEIEKEIKSLGGNETERNRLKEILSFQIQEIENANLVDGEEEELRDRFKFISQSENIFEKVGGAVSKLDEGMNSVTSGLFEAKSLLSSFSDFQDIEECQERLNSAYYEIKDVAEILDNIVKNTDFDENELERIDKRLDLIKSLKKKYGNSISEILNFLKETKERLENLENSEFALNKLNTKKEKTISILTDLCEELSVLRKNYALILEEKIKKELDELQMKGTNFKVNFTKGEIGKRGFDIVKFVFSANQGQEMKDLSKTASGGELSRLLLAFKGIMLDKENVATVVFDEIDSGISGQTAGKVAEKLNKISEFVQVICITHTPVVASKGDEFILVTKKNENGETISNAEIIEGEDVVEQIARLIDGNEKVSTTALDHARKLLSL